MLNSVAVDLARAEARLDKLEGAISLDERDGDVCWMYDEEVGIEAKVHRTLRGNVAFWQQLGALQFTLSVIRNGYILDLLENIGFYEQRNNKSYREYKGWANKSVQKLLSAKIVRKVSKEELTCVNPLSVATNSKSKKRLCIDLSRKYNGVSRTRKFRIESTREALQVIRKGDWMFSFDFKSAYLMIPVHPRFVRYLGFMVEEEDGSKSYYCYLILPFRLNDAARVLTRVMKSPIERWRKQGIVVFIHNDDGFVCTSDKGDAMRASEVVRRDLVRYRLLLSESKCMWGARRTLEWTGLVFDTVRFRLTVPEWKLTQGPGGGAELVGQEGVVGADQGVGQCGLVVGQFQSGHGGGHQIPHQEHAHEVGGGDGAVRLVRQAVSGGQGGRGVSIMEE